jgi:uncharacterized protein YneF (UPF0154 family)
MSVYVYAVLAFLVAAALGVWLMRKAEKEEEPAEQGA